MTQLSLSKLVETGDLAAVRGVLDTQSVRDQDVSWAMMRCIKFKQREILDVLLGHTRTHLRPAADFFSGPLSWAVSAEEDVDVFEHILKEAPSKYSALKGSLTNLMEQERSGANEYVLAKFELWCDKADASSLQQALESVVVWNLPRFLHHLYPKWVAAASEQQIFNQLFENLMHCFSWGEMKQGARLRHPEIYDFLLTHVTEDVAQKIFDKIALDRSSKSFEYLPGKPEIYELWEPMLQSFLQKNVLNEEIQGGVAQPLGVRKM